MDKKKLIVLCDPARARNPFISLTLEGDGKVLGKRGALLLGVTVNFEWYETHNTRVGLHFSCVRGALESCSVSIARKIIKKVEVDVQHETLEKVTNGKDSSSGLVAKVRELGGNLGQRRSLVQIREDKRVARYNMDHITFNEYAKGTDTEWHFKPAPGKLFLEEPRNFMIRIVPDKGCPSAKGDFSAETLRYLHVTVRNGKPLSQIKRWISLAKIKKEYSTKDVTVGFSFSERDGQVLE